MALTRAEYLEHLRRAAFRGVAVDPERMLPPMVTGMIDYVQNGTLGTQADRREAVRIMVNAIWQGLLGRGYDGHHMKHWLVQQGVPSPLAEEVPNLAEPLV